MDYKVDISQFTDEIKEIKYIVSNSGGEERKTSSLYFKKIQMKDLNDTQRNNILKYFSKYAEIMSRENEKNSLLQLKNYKEITEYYDNIQEIQKKIQQKVSTGPPYLTRSPNKQHNSVTESGYDGRISCCPCS